MSGLKSYREVNKLDASVSFGISTEVFSTSPVAGSVTVLVSLILESFDSSKSGSRGMMGPSSFGARRPFPLRVMVGAQKNPGSGELGVLCFYFFACVHGIRCAGCNVTMPYGAFRHDDDKDCEL